MGLFDLDRITGDSDEAFDVVSAVLLAGEEVRVGISVDALGREDERFTALGLAEVVGEFINEDEVS